MSNKNKILSIAVIVIIAVIAAVMLVPKDKASDSGTERDGQPLIESASKTDYTSSTAKSNDPLTIANQWQWQELEDQLGQSQTMTNTGTDLPFTPQSVYDALQAVKVDEDGNVVLDHDALVSLDEALERIHNKLDSESLLELQDLIKEALPGKVGEQTAQLVGDYFQFLEAKEEFSQMHEGSGASQQTLASIKSDEALYGELQSLRKVYLGSDVADSLFQVSDANARFMFESMKLDLDNSLTAEEKDQRRQEIEAQFNQEVTPASD